MIAVLVGSIIGLVLGLTGAGGSIFAIPMLIFILKLPMQEAVGLSLITVAASAIFGIVHRLGSGGVSWKVALTFALSGAIFTPAGLYLAKIIPETYLLTAFIILMWLVAGRMFLQSRHHPEHSQTVRAYVPMEKRTSRQPVCIMGQDDRLKSTLPCRFTLLFLGSITGILSGMFGVGGGFLIVPALIFFTQLSIYQAVSTSLAVIMIISTSGVVSYIMNSSASLDYGLILQLISGAVVGMIVGTFSAKKIAGPRLQQLFSVLILVVSVIMGWHLI